MFLSSKIFVSVSLVAFLAAGMTASAASTNPWAMPQQQGQTHNNAQGQTQGGFSMGGGFNLGGGSGGGNQPQANLTTPQYIAPQNVPTQPLVPKQQVQSQNKVQTPAPQQFGVYAPLMPGNTETSIVPAKPQVQVAPRPVQPYVPVQPYIPVQPQYYGQPYNYGQVPYGFNPGFGGFGFPGFGGFPGFNGFNNFGFGFGFGGNLVAPGPMMPGYSNPYYQNFQQPRYQQPQYRVQPGRTSN